jgi:hypothetical protein
VFHENKRLVCILPHVWSYTRKTLKSTVEPQSAPPHVRAKIRALLLISRFYACKIMFYAFVSVLLSLCRNENTWRHWYHCGAIKIRTHTSLFNVLFKTIQNQSPETCLRKRTKGSQYTILHRPPNSGKSFKKLRKVMKYNGFQRVYAKTNIVKHK